jgi:hypothetical protein
VAAVTTREVEGGDGEQGERGVAGRGVRLGLVSGFLGGEGIGRGVGWWEGLFAKSARGYL